MAHNIQSMMYYGEVPWHGLGRPLDRPATAKEAIEAASLDWEVEKLPLYAGEGGKVLIPACFAMVRRDLYKLARSHGTEKTQCPVFGIVGKNYTPLQNKEAFSFFDSIVGQGAAIYHTAGALGEGERIWILAKLPDRIRVIGDDITEKYLLLSNSHDGQSAVQIKFTPVRVVCQNTLNMALSYGGITSVAHYPSLPRRLEQAQELLGIIKTSYASIEESFKAMTKVSFSQKTLHQYYDNVIPLPTAIKDPMTERKYEYVKKQHEAFEVVFQGGRGRDLKGVSGTLWAAYNSIVELTDYKKTKSSQEKRLESIWFGRGASLKVKAFQVADSWPKAA